MRKLLVVRYGEIALKKLNRHVFIKQLLENIAAALKNFKNCQISKEHGRIYIEFNASDYHDIAEKVKNIYGIVSFSPADVVPLDIDCFCERAVLQMKRLTQQHGALSFKVETRRANKDFALKSPEVSSKVGAAILKQCQGVTVDVHKPQFICWVEIRERAYVFTEIIKGQGGLPYRSAGKGLLLLSGGIDSPVAGHLMARRGLEIECVHYHSYPYTSERAHQKVEKLARQLAVFTQKIRLHSINLLDIQKSIAQYCPSEEMTILSRRAMMKIASRIALKRKCEALVTGESLGQVASQTLQGIVVTTEAASMPILRPLVAMDKLDIMRMAEDIGTYQTSIEPYEDCCTVFLPKRVVTKPKLASIVASEQLYPLDQLISEALAKMESQTLHAEEALIL